MLFKLRKAVVLSPQPRILLLCFAASAAGLIGCNDPAHEQRLAQRRESFNKYVDFIGNAEAARPGKLAYTGEVAAQQHQRDREHLDRDLDMLGRGLEHEFQRFHDNQPAYEREIHQQLRGKPENIEKTLPYALW